DMRALFETILAKVPAPGGDPDAPLQLQLSALDYSSYVGRLGIGRIRRGRIAPGQEVMALQGSSACRTSPRPRATSFWSAASRTSRSARRSLRSTRPKRCR